MAPHVGVKKTSFTQTLTQPKTCTVWYPSQHALYCMHTSIFRDLADPLAASVTPWLHLHHMASGETCYKTQWVAKLFGSPTGCKMAPVVWDLLTTSRTRANNWSIQQETWEENRAQPLNGPLLCCLLQHKAHLLADWGCLVYMCGWMWPGAVLSIKSSLVWTDRVTLLCVCVFPFCSAFIWTAFE